MDATGRGAEVKTVEVERDIQVSSTPPQEYNHPKPRPPAWCQDTFSKVASNLSFT